jgi:prophage regulatory protein
MAPFERKTCLKASGYGSDQKVQKDLDSKPSSIPRRPTSIALASTPLIRRPELRKIVPLGDTTIYELEQKGEFPQRFYLTARCVVWDLREVEAWIEKRRSEAESGELKTTPGPDVRLRKTRPVKREK